MKQRNDTGYEKDIMVWPEEGEPETVTRRVGAGEEIDFPTLLAGFTVVEDKPVAPEPKAKSKEAAAAADTKEGESQ